MYTISNLAASDSKSKKQLSVLLIVKLGTIEISAKRTIVRWGLLKRITTFPDFSCFWTFLHLKKLVFLKLKEHFNISIKISPGKYPSVRKTDIFVCCLLRSSSERAVWVQALLEETALWVTLWRNFIIFGCASIHYGAFGEIKIKETLSLDFSF